MPLLAVGAGRPTGASPGSNTLRRMRRIGVLAILVLLAGCGGGGDDKDAQKSETKAAAPAASQPSVAASPAPPSAGGGGGGSQAKARYIKKADKVCTSARSKLKPLHDKAVKVAV